MSITVWFSDGTSVTLSGRNAVRLIEMMQNEGWQLRDPEPLIYEPALGRVVRMSDTEKVNSPGGVA